MIKICSSTAKNIPTFRSDRHNCQIKPSEIFSSANNNLIILFLFFSLHYKLKFSEN